MFVSYTAHHDLLFIPFWQASWRALILVAVSQEHRPELWQTRKRQLIPPPKQLVPGNPLEQEPLEQPSC